MTSATKNTERVESRITERMAHMRGLLAKYRAAAIALHARLVALELAGNENIAPLRRALIASSVQIESISSFLGDPPCEPRLARGTEQLDEWIDQPTLRR